MHHTQDSYRCFYTSCRQSTGSLRSLVLHMRSYHSFETQTFTCNIDGCKDIFHSVSTFRKHVTYMHKDKWNVLPPTHNNVVFDDAGVSQSDGNDVGPTCLTGQLEQDNVSLSAPEEDKYANLMQDVSKQFLRLQLSLHYKLDMPERKVNSVMDTVSDLLKGFKSSYDECLSDEVGNCMLSEDVRFMLHDSISLDNALKITPASEENVLKEMGYIQPIEILFPTDPGGKKECGHYVSVEETLKHYLSRPDVFSSIQREHVNENVLDKMSSGLVMDNHPVLCYDKSCIRLVMYTDEFQICNALGSHTQMHSIVGVYFSVNNIEMTHSGKLVHIHLAMLVKEFFVKKHTKEIVFHRLLQDLSRLETQGMNVVVEGVEHHFKVVVAAFVGDNKSLHGLGGFNSCFSSGKVCRHCLIDYKDLTAVRNESQCNLRTVEAHDYHVRSVLTDQALSSVYGVRGSSVFSVLKSFHPVTSLPCDIMHDVYEGVMPFNMRALIRGLINDKVLSMNQIRDLFEKFPYGPSDTTNKQTSFPTKFPGKNISLPGTAAEKLNMFRMFTLIVGPSVPKDNKYWLLHLKCLEICDILLAPALQFEWISVLDRMVDEYLFLWSDLPVDVVGKMKPKMHYLIHMARLCLIFGAPRHLSCMRFEHFHLFFKRESNVMKSYINPTLTLATNFQKKRCLDYSTSDIFVSVDIQGAQKTLSSDSLSPLEKEVVTSHFQHGNSTLHTVSRVKIDGRHLIANEYVIIDVNHENVPIFLKIVNIYNCDGEWAVYGKLTFPVCWCAHLHAYEVDTALVYADFVCVSPYQIVPLQTLSLYVLEGKKYLKPRHRPLPVNN